ncbi:MAG: hypothetical protein HRT38_15445 [Alteromonadaceae bacterium]|nr:hypothetical protein [Alteromonadaceae bacterium]
MIIKIQNIKQLGAVAKHVRKSQSLDQETAGLLSGNGLTFISQFENGKEGSFHFPVGQISSIL